MPTTRKPADRPDVQQVLSSVEMTSAVDLILEPEGDAANLAAGSRRLPRFSMLAYTGAPVRIGYSDIPVVVDLNGGGSVPPVRPVLMDHWPSADMVVGHTTAINVDATGIHIEGLVSGTSDASRQVVEFARNGYPWQASIGIAPTSIERLEAGSVAFVNSRQISGPALIIRAWNFKEVSFVVLGADDKTSAAVAARLRPEGPIMPEAILPTSPHSTPSPTPAAAGDPAPAPDLVADQRMRLAAEYDRVAAVTAACGANHAMCATAIRDGWTAERAQLEALRAERPVAPAGIVAADKRVAPAIMCAALCQAGGLHNIEKAFDANTLTQAHERFKSMLSLQELLDISARANGYSGGSVRSNAAEIMRLGFSGLDLPNILGNVANKFLLAGYDSVESSWQDIAEVGGVVDFKQRRSYRMTADATFAEVGSGGELASGSTAEMEYTNQAKTYGRMFAITRQDIINDDLGALTSLPQRIGRGAALKFNLIFWAAWLSDSAFFNTDNSKLNYTSGAGTVLSLTSLGAVEAQFMAQLDGESNPLGAEAAILLTPPALSVTARTIFTSTEMRDTTASTKAGTANVFAGKYRPVVSSYLNSSAVAGGSATAWYLLADPRAVPGIEVVFLNNVRKPTVQTAEADFSTLGIQMRGFFDFGISLKDYRCGVKSKGAA